MTTWDYLPRRRWTPLVPFRRWMAARRPRQVPGPGEEILGWEVRVSDNAGPDLPAAGTMGVVVAAELRGGVLHHRLEFPGLAVVRPVAWPDQAWPGIDLLAPA